MAVESRGVTVGSDGVREAVTLRLLDASAEAADAGALGDAHMHLSA